MSARKGRDGEKKASEIRKQFERYTTEWQPIRDEADEDMKYVSGDPWTQRDKRLRADAMRPVIVNDELHQFFNQVINDARLNPRAVKFSAAPEKPNPLAEKTARLYNDKWREVEYRSNAPRHYITALQNAIHRGFGWTRVSTRYESPRSDLHDLWIEGVPNPNMIVPDPDSLYPDSSDMRGLFTYHDIGKAEYLRRFPDAEVRDFGTDLQRAYKGWVKSKERIQIAEFWEVEAVIKKLVVLKNRELAIKHLKPEILGDADHEVHTDLARGGAVGVYADELASMPEDDEDIQDIREIEDRKVVQYLTNGVEILKTKQWPGKYIPFASCFGQVLYLDKNGTVERQILSMTRLARQPYMAMCYLAAAKLEMIGMMPKFPYFVYKGTLSPKMWKLLEKSLHEPVAGIEVDGYPDGHNAAAGPLPPPIRQPYNPELQAIEIAYESSRRSVQAAMGISPLPTPAQRNNEKTGAALGRIESSGQKGSYHFFDNYDGMIRQTGIIGEDLMEPTLDTARTIATMDAFKRPVPVEINDPNNANAISIKGKHIVTVSSAPAESSAREAAGDFVQSLMQSPVLGALGPQIIAKVLAMGIRLQNIGIVGDETADLLDPQPNGEMTPQMLQGQLAQAKQIAQSMQQKIQELEQEKAGKVVELQGKAAIQDRKLIADAAEGDKDRAVKLDIAAIQAKLEEMGLFLEELKRIGGLKESMAQRLHDASHKVADHVHDVATATLDHAHTLTEQEQLHQHATEQLQTEAALAPPPAASSDSGV